MKPNNREFNTLSSKRFIYDLGAVTYDLAKMGRFPPKDQTPQAWVVEHLRSYHNLEVDDLYPLTRNHNLSLIDERCERVARAITVSLYTLFRPMAFLAMEATITDMSFKHDILTVTLYNEHEN